MIPQIGNRANRLPFGGRPPHDEGISIVESEILRHSDALLLERGLNVGFGRAPLFQNLLGNGPGVFRIDINAAAA